MRDDYSEIKRKNSLYDAEHPGWREAAAAAEEEAKQLRHQALEKPCEGTELVQADIRRIGGAVSGDPNNPFVGPIGNLSASINPNGQSYATAESSVRSLGFSYYLNLEPQHWNGDDFQARFESGLYYHITIGRPGTELNPLMPTPWITIHCHGTPPSGGHHLNDWLYMHGFPDLPTWLPWPGDWN